MLTGQINRLVVLDGEIIIIDPIRYERKLGRRFKIVLVGRFNQFTLFSILSDRNQRLLLFDNQSLKSLDRGLNRTLIDVTADPAPSELLSNKCCSPRPNEAIQYQVP